MEWTRKEVAQGFEVSSTTVGEWVKDAHFPEATKDPADGRRWVYRASEVIRWFVRREVNRTVGHSNASQDPGAEPRDLLNLQQERARLARAQAEAKELELAVKRGELVGAGDALQALSHAIGAARHVLLQVHAQIAQTHPGLPTDVIEHVRTLHHEALTALSETRMPGRSDDETDNADG